MAGMGRSIFRRDMNRPQHFVPMAEGFGAAVRSAWVGACCRQLSAP
jgi:hypothetical protein